VKIVPCAIAAYTRRMDARMRQDLARLHRLIEHGLDLPTAVQIEWQIREQGFTFGDTRREIVQSMSRAAYTIWWMQEQERKREETGRELPWRGGERIDDYVPKTTRPSAKRWAEETLAMYERETRMPVELLYWLAERAEGRHSREPSPDEFGYSLAMRAMGTGVSWFDNHPYFEPLQSVQFHHDYYGY
jgi:hypothetical protein